MEVGLVLGGGGARCFAQIGVLRAFEERAVTPVAIAACSTAAIIGALYAAGQRSTSIHKIASEANLRDFINLGGSTGLMDQAGVEALLRPYVPESFEDLAIPLATVATDVQRGELIVLRSGPLIPAVCASNAFPGIFSPVRHNGRDLIDGGVLNLVPVDVIRSLTTRPVIAVDVSLSPRRKLDLDEDVTLWNKITMPFKMKRLPLFLDLLDKAYTITQSQVTQLRYASYPPEAIIKPDLTDDFKIHDFDCLEEAVELGYRKATEVLEQVSF
ncbi:MAG: patatin-like phospholipase family protein [Deinococcota bacterium]|nr:patatin-like phospholipase family protein [Deinococcota bacterium]